MQWHFAIIKYTANMSFLWLSYANLISYHRFKLSILLYGCFKICHSATRGFQIKQNHPPTLRLAKLALHVFSLHHTKIFKSIDLKLFPEFRLSFYFSSKQSTSHHLQIAYTKELCLGLSSLSLSMQRDSKPNLEPLRSHLTVKGTSQNQYPLN